MRGGSLAANRASLRFITRPIAPALRRCYGSMLKRTTGLGQAAWSGIRFKSAVAIDGGMAAAEGRSSSAASKLSFAAESQVTGHWTQLTTEAGRVPVATWLFGSCAVVCGMVMLGGATRLTHSGLSMVEWKPQQLLPPMNEAEWEEEFGKYKQYPEFKELNPDMVLSEFKPIFWYEYGHRLLGRAIGVLFAVPATYFGIRGYIKAPLGMRLGALFALGGCQGAIGWWMVKSGLEESTCKSTGDDNIVRVSPYRLASHLLGAFTIYAGMVWTGLSVAQRVPPELSQQQLASVLRLRRVAHPVAALIGVTAISGAFVAGMKAGHHYNTFPLMDGEIFPERYWEMTPWYRNMFENVAAVQFDHRLLAVSTLTSVTAMAALARTMNLPKNTRMAVALLLGTSVAQVSLGITTLIYAVPVQLGVAHQGGALTLFTVALYTLHTLRLKNPAAAWQRVASQLK